MRWRIRRKLMLGLALVVGIMAVLLVGALQGMLSYSSTMKAMDRKLDELITAQGIQNQAAVMDLHINRQSDSFVNTENVQEGIAALQRALEVYGELLDQTVSDGRDADDGEDEGRLTAILQGRVEVLKQKAQTLQAVQLNTGHTQPDPGHEILGAIRQFQREAGELREHIHTDLRNRIRLAKDDYRTSRAFVVLTSVVGIILLIGLGRLAYAWIADPIRDLHENVGQLAQGRFDSRIQITSGDELQELGQAFNEMAEKLQGTYRNLAQQVNERSKQLVRSERLAGVGFLAAGVAHEINNPLASIAFCSEALERRFNEFVDRSDNREDVETVQNYLNMIQQEAFRCKEITQRLLEFSRVGERRREPTDLAELIQSVIDMVLHLQSYKGKEILFDARCRPIAWVNGPEIKSIILNLTVNALESMDEDGQLRITLSEIEDAARIEFVDNGCGMSEETLENIFEPFYTQSRTGKGTGLGLSISHRVISQHGGEIEAHSDGPGQGSTFAVQLPLNADQNTNGERLAA